MDLRTKKLLIIFVASLFILISTTDVASASYGTATSRTVEVPAAELAQDQPVSGDKRPVFLNMKKGAELR